MTEGTPPTSSSFEEYQQLNRTLLEKVLDKASAEPTWKQRFLEDQQAAMAEFPEERRLKEIYQQSAATPITEAAPPEATAPPFPCGGGVPAAAG